MVNVTDYSESNYPPFDPKTATMVCFEHQKELEYKYHSIEVANGFASPVHHDLDDPYVQDCIKHASWCVVEELAEMVEAHGNSDPTHWQEEFADALHFYLSICVRTSMHPPEIFDREYMSMYPMERVIVQLGLMCNTLKNKRWKTTHHMTDRKKFAFHLDEAGIALVYYWNYLNPNWSGKKSKWEHLYDMYHRKNKVNKFRQESKY